MYFYSMPTLVTSPSASLGSNFLTSLTYALSVMTSSVISTISIISAWIYPTLIALVPAQAVILCIFLLYLLLCLHLLLVSYSS